jgi:antitoxin component of MazEF toxin-antitoxin module
MLKIKLERWGKSLAVRLPTSAVEALGVDIGGKLDVDLVDGVVTIRPAQSARSGEATDPPPRDL